MLTLTDNSPSRGSIPLELLKQERFDPLEWKKIIQELKCKNFNVIFGDLSQKVPDVYVYSSETSKLSNISFDDQKVFSLANGGINSNSSWNKQEKGENMIENMISTDNFTESSLFSVLK